MLPDHIRGRMVDLDSHLMLFPREAEAILGPGPGGGVWQSRRGGWSTVDEIRQMVEDEGLDPSGDGSQLARRRDEARDDVWQVKLWGAHGAQIAGDRVDAVEKMGIGHQFVFSQFMEGPLNAACPEALAAVTRYNDYVLDWARDGAGRLVPVCVVNTHDRSAALDETRRALDGGAGGIHLSGILPPAGLSPAAPEWDPLWAMLGEAGVPALLHYGSSAGAAFTINTDWFTAAHRSLKPPPGDPDEGNFHAPPFIWMTAHYYAELTLTHMVLGGVFERHPGLRFGVVESGGSWVASWCDRMDNLAVTTSSFLSRTLSLKPSEYVRRQIRVAPFPFEPVGTWIERSGLSEVYVFSTDYPHEEGGVAPVPRFLASLEPLGPEVVERFFVTNGADLLPATVRA
ncbi:MAG TPA: amidohydrolase family protein [Acidimicrobiales bacterium]|nr:amidohydrolase family protein [Acidimicrobiales bacterium]